MVGCNTKDDNWNEEYNNGWYYLALLFKKEVRSFIRRFNHFTD